MAKQLYKNDIHSWRQQRETSGSEQTAWRDFSFLWGERTYMMGIVNISPDSFAGDGLNSTDDAVRQALRFVQEGADIIDIGGESTRPGTTPLSDREAIDLEIGRVIPVLEKLKGKLGVPVSIDTYKLEVAKVAVEAGADIINDIWGLMKSPGIARLSAEHNLPLILMANQRESPARYILPTVLDNLKESVDRALDGGVPWNNMIVDPGIGFGKTLEQNYELIRRLGELKVLGRPILLGSSRKSFIGLTLDLPPEQRLEGTSASVAIGIAAGADIIRVHDVKEITLVCRMSDAIIRTGRRS